MRSANTDRFHRLTGPFRRLSLKGRLVLMTVGLFVVFIWAMVFLSATVLHRQLETLLSEQQFAAARRVASSLDTRLKDNLSGLTSTAAGLPDDLSYAALQPLLVQRPYLHLAFSGGIAVIGLDGVAIADYPASPGRRGAYFGDRDYFRKVVETGQPYIDKPIIGRALKRPVLTTAVPVFAADGRLRAVLTGITDLTAPNFLGFVTDRAQIGNGEYFVMSLRDRIIVAATDGKRAMQASPEPGLNLLYDRMADGFEGSGVAVSSEGVGKLYSGVRVPTADWLILAALPTEVAFEPVTTLRNYFYLIAGLLTLAAVLLIRLMLRRLLAPLKAAGHAMQRMTGGEVPLAQLPVVRNDEVGQLVGNFNQLIVDRQRYEAALADSEQRFRLLVEQAPEGIFVQTRGRFAYINHAALTLFGAASKEQLLNQAIVDRIDPDYRDRVAERVCQVNDLRLSNPAMEKVYLRLDGTPVAVEASAVPFRFDGEDGALVFVRDITERKVAEDVQQRLGRALKLVSECSLALVRANEEQELLDSICRLIVETGGYLIAWVGIPEHDAERSVRIISRFGGESGYLDSLRISWGSTDLGRGPTGTTIRTGITQVNQDFLTNPAVAPWRAGAAKYGYQSSIALPLSTLGVVFGSLTLYSAEANAFGAEEVKLLEKLAANLVFGLESLRSRAAHLRAENRLHLTQERLQGLFGSITDAVFMHGLREDGQPGCFIEVNDVACRRLGYSRAELLAMSPQEIDAPDHQVDLGAIVEKLAKQKSAVFEQMHLARDGRRIPVEINSSAFTLHGQTMIVSLVRDITERKEAEQLRSESARELHQLSTHLETVREEERTRLAREMHDELGQLLTALKMDITLLRGDLPVTGNLLTKLERMTALADQTLDAVRRIASELRPTMLDDLGLKAAVEWLTEELEKRYSGIRCHLVFALNGGRVEGELATAAYRIIQECLTNVVRHAEASKIHIVVAIPDQRHLIISVQDNGRGLPEMKIKNQGFGLLGMQERVNALGGSLTVDSIPGEGVLVDVTIPLPSTNSGT